MLNKKKKQTMKRVFGKKKDVGPAPSLSDAGGRVDERVTKIDEKVRDVSSVLRFGRFEGGSSNFTCLLRARLTSTLALDPHRKLAWKSRAIGSSFHVFEPICSSSDVGAPCETKSHFFCKYDDDIEAFVSRYYSSSMYSFLRPPNLSLLPY